MASTQELINKIQETNEIKKKEKTIEEKIRDLDSELTKYDDIRKTINYLKQEKDTLILKYIENTFLPNQLSLDLINYKALFFYFKQIFIEQDSKFLDYQDYKNNVGSLQETKRGLFEKAFGESQRIYIATKTTNFPHLIGYKQDEEDEFGCRNTQKNSQFLNNIYYETNLLEDYQDHGCDKQKIQSLSWIWQTLKKPIAIFEQDALSGTKLKADLIFVRWQRDVFHYVGLKKILESSKNKYVINSHHPMDRTTFNRIFNKNKKIYEFDFS